MDVTLVIEGIPFAFGTRAGLSIGTTDTPALDINNAADPLVSVAAIVPESVSLGGAELDLDRGFVPPQSVSLQLHSSPTWDRYFERRRSPITRLATAVDHNDTAWTVGSTSGMTAGDVLYIGREAVSIDSVDSATTLTVTRNHYKLTITRDHSHPLGSVISASPRHLLGRACEFRFWLGNGVDNERQDYLYLTSSPIFNRDEGKWEFNFDTAMRHFDKKLHVGFKGSKIVDLAFTETDVDVDVEDGTEFTFNTTINGEALIEFRSPDIYDARHMIVDVDAQSGDTVTVDRDSWVTNLTRGDLAGQKIWRVYDLSRSPVYAALVCMLSDRGDGDNHATYDIMYGRTTSGTASARRVVQGESETRFGAAVPAALVDVAGIEALEDTVTGWNLVLGADGKEMGLLELLEEVAFAVNGYWVFVDGKITLRLHESAYASDTINNTLTESEILRDSQLSVTDDEQDVIHTLNIACNYGRGATYYGDITSYYIEEKEIFREVRGERSYKRKTLVVDVPEADLRQLWLGNNATILTLEDMRMRFDRFYARRANGIRKYMLTLPWRFMQMRPGDRVRITHEKLNDFAGGSLSAFECIIVGINPDIQGGTVMVEAHEVPSAKLIAPVGVVASWDGGTNIVTLSTNTKFGGGTGPAYFYRALWSVVFLDASVTPRFSFTSNNNTISGLGNGLGAELAFSSAPVLDSGDPPAVGDLVLLSAFDDQSSTDTTNSAQSAKVFDYAFMSDGNIFPSGAPTLGSGNNDPHLWG